VTDQARTVSREELREATLSAVRWSTLARFGGELLALASTVVLARLIAPEQFGRVVVTLVLIEIASTLAAHGFGTLLVQRESLTREHVRTALGLAILLGAGLSALVIAGAPLAVPPLYGHASVGLFQLMAPAFFLAGPGAVAHSLLERRMDFRRISMIEISGNLVGIVVSVGLAVAGLGAVALILGRLSSVATLTGLKSLVAGVPSPKLDRGVAREIVSFGGQSAGGAVVYAIQRNADYAIVGAAIGPAAAGLYWRAFNLAVEYQGKITTIMQQVAFPVFARAESLDDMRALRTRIVRVHTAAILPLLALLAAIAPVLIPWLYGQRWEAAVVPTQILAAAGIVYPIAGGLGALVLAAGMPRVLLLLNLAQLSLYVGALIWASRFGVVGICVASVGVAFVVTLATHWFVVDRRLGIPILQVGKDVAPALVSSLALAAVAWPIRLALVHAGVAAPLVLVAASVAGGPAYLLALRTLFPSAWGDFALLVVSVLPARLRARVRRSARERRALSPA
jgi:O-antigen/teichoic acid export membrane protein